MSQVLSYSDDLLGYGDNIFHHLPNATAPSYQACLICYCVCAGVLGLELLNNLDYDWTIATRSGWLSWSKCPNRVAYFISRYASFTFLVITIIYTVAPNLNCSSYALISQIMWLCPLISVDFIFLQRTVALYGWNKIIVIILYSFFLIDLAFAICAIIWFGFGFQIPNSQFCAFYTFTNSSQPHASLFIVYCIVLNTLDTLILCLTLHRLVDGGLLAVPGKIKNSLQRTFISSEEKRNEEFSTIIPRTEPISSLLIRQGLHYYIILEVARLAYMIIYYTNKDGNSTYQILGSAILATIGPILANRLFRETSEFIRARAVIRSNHNNQFESNMMTLPLTSPTTFKMQPIRPFDKSSSNGDSDSLPRLKANTAGLNIYIGQNRILFADDYEAREGVARYRPHQSRILSYAEPPSASSFISAMPGRATPHRPISRAAHDPSTDSRSI